MNLKQLCVKMIDIYVFLYILPDDMLHQPIITTDPLLSYRHKRDDLFRPSLESANTYLNEEERSDVNLIQSKQIPWRPNKV